MQKVDYNRSVMDYMYCMNSMTKARLDSLGGGIPLNQKVDQFSGSNPFLMNSDMDQFSDLLPDGESQKMKFFKTKDDVPVMGRKAATRLGFLDGKLSYLKIDFGKCNCTYKVMQETVRELGTHTTSTYDPILLYSVYTWNGLKFNLRLIDNDSKVIFEISKR